MKPWISSLLPSYSEHHGVAFSPEGGRGGFRTLAAKHISDPKPDGAP